MTPLPPGPYKLIYADPPWLYNDNRTGASAGMALSAYPCMTQLELYAIEVKALADPNGCLLALWTTMPKLVQAIELIHWWEFTYVTVGFTWLKANPRWNPASGVLRTASPGGDIYSGLGHYTKANQEMVLFARRGKPLPRADRSVKQVIVAPRGRHSAKPAEARDRLVRLFGDVPRIELFARERVAGWDAWGHDVPTAPRDGGNP